MRYVFFAIVAWAMGFMTAVPIGATQVEIAKRALKNELRAAFMVVLGSVASDMMYGAIALFGLARFFANPKVAGYFGLGGAVILWILAFLTFREAAKPHALDLDRPSLSSGHISFVTGFSLAVTNPAMIFWWLVGVKIIQDLGLVTRFGHTAAVSLLLFGGAGLLSYLVLLSFILHRIHHMISAQKLRRIYQILGVVLIALSGYFVYAAIRDLSGHAIPTPQPGTPALTYGVDPVDPTGGGAPGPSLWRNAWNISSS